MISFEELTVENKDLKNKIKGLNLCWAKQAKIIQKQAEKLQQREILEDARNAKKNETFQFYGRKYSS